MNKPLRKVGPRAGTRAFTLLELLMAVAILTVLFALGLAAVGTSRRNAAATQVVSNLRSMSGALMAYVADYNGKLPEGAFGPSLAQGELAGQRVRFWFNALDYYLGGSDYTLAGMGSLERPKWQNDPLKKFPAGFPSVNGFATNVGFGWNHQQFGYDKGENNAYLGWGSRLSQVEQPAKTIIIGTGRDSLNLDNPVVNVLLYANSNPCERYSGGGFYLFLDSHVEKLTPQEATANQSFLFKKTKK